MRRIMLGDVAAASADVAATSSRKAKVERLAALLRDASPEEAAIAASWLMGELPQGRIGLGPAALRDAAGLHAANVTVTESVLTARDVDDAFRTISGLSGPGSNARRIESLGRLLARARPDEQHFLARLIHGELRQGALEGVMTDAVASATNLPVADVRRAAQLAGDLPAVARAAGRGGAAALREFGVQLFRPLQPMLAAPAADVSAALAKLQSAAFDWKLDGARIQVHRDGDLVRVYTRRLNDVTDSLPEIVETVRALPARSIVLDGEAIAMRPDGRPEPFQVTMARFGSRVDVERLREATPLSTFFFDILFVDGRSLLDTPASQRFDVMNDMIPTSLIVPRLITADEDEASAFMADALARGHEGVVAKALDAGYEAGRRGSAWLKLKQADTLDLVVLAAEWGSGRRQGWLSNLHLGARDPEHGGFVMLGKTFKGLTDTLLEWQTRELLARETHRDGRIVYVRPELVVEIAYEGVQTSTRYAGGMALRFARVRRYREDKTAADADTVAGIRRRHTGSGTREATGSQNP